MAQTGRRRQEPQVGYTKAVEEQAQKRSGTPLHGVSFAGGQMQPAVRQAGMMGMAQGAPVQAAGDPRRAMAQRMQPGAAAGGQLPTQGGAAMMGGMPQINQRMWLQLMAQRRRAEAMRQGQRSAPQGFEGTAQGMANPDPVRDGRQMPVNEDRIREARQMLKKYQAAKELTDQRIIAAQQWWRQRDWEQIELKRGTKGTQPIKSATGWLKSSIIGKHADYIESYPEPLFLARNQEDEVEAQHLSEIVPVVLKQIGFEETYDDVGWQKHVEGTGLYAVTWDGAAQHGLGDISITKVNALNIFTEPGIEDIQDSSNVFCVRMEDDNRLLARYPQLQGKLGRQTVTTNEYVSSEEDKTGKSTVIDWYYKKWQGNREVLHYCQFVGDEILYASENEPQTAQRGHYDHGLYPFIPDGLLPVAGSMWCHGMVDLCSDVQTDIDTMSQAMVTNAVANATPRYFMRQDGGVNAEQFLNWSLPLIDCNTNLGSDTLQKVDVPQMDGNTLSFYQAKVEELKSISGNTEVANGEVPSGVTSGVAIAALKEDAGKTSKDSNRASYRAMAKLYLMVVELIRQFYSMERQFRIVGEDGMVSYQTYSNARLRMQTQLDGYGGVTHRLPLFDVDVHVQRENAYTRMAVNDMATQFYQMGAFNPMAAPQVLNMLQMMDFTGKDKMVKIIQNGFMQTMAAMGGMAPGGAPQPQQGGPGAAAPEPTEDDATEAGQDKTGTGHTAATNRMEQRINNATRP